MKVEEIFWIIDMNSSYVTFSELFVILFKIQVTYQKKLFKIQVKIRSLLKERKKKIKREMLSIRWKSIQSTNLETLI
jgi:hypothetical protein